MTWTEGIRRLRAVDPRLADGALAALLAGGAAAQLVQEGQHGPLRWLAVMGTVLPLVVRRRFPLACFWVIFACALLSLQPPTYAGYAAAFLAVYGLGAYSTRRVLAFASPVAAAIALAVAAALAGPPPWFLEVPAWLAELTLGLALLFLGYAIRQLQGRAGRLERERELATRVAVADERARLARELHDVVAHSVSVMLVQAGAARRAVERRPDATGEALLEVERNGREALGELRRMLDVLTEEGGEPSLAPQPGLEQLGPLAERMAAAGLPVAVRYEGTSRPLSPGVDLTAYRIVQEALTNSLKYAKGARTEVVVEFGARELRVEVVDSGGSAAAEAGSSGRGLVGMRERVSAYGGDLQTGGRPEGGFAVRARLPLEPG
ncbi:MAG: sensor histidine kinase [Candidatus Dormibacteraeota bacterium]|nr:sensor histidine kinase [Candidatus Dormibacteraeota bacterium]